MKTDPFGAMTAQERAVADRIRLAKRAPFALPRLRAERRRRRRLKKRLLAKPLEFRNPTDWRLLHQIADHELWEQLGVITSPFPTTRYRTRQLDHLPL